MEMIAYLHSYWQLFILSSTKYLTKFKKPAISMRVFFLHIIFNKIASLKLNLTIPSWQPIVRLL